VAELVEQVDLLRPISKARKAWPMIRLQMSSYSKRLNDWMFGSRTLRPVGFMDRMANQS